MEHSSSGSGRKQEISAAEDEDEPSAKRQRSLSELSKRGICHVISLKDHIAEIGNQGKLHNILPLIQSRQDKIKTIEIA